jgi:tRNA threonylcarbamoyladenosine biosynthesis protein TsaE
MHRTERPSHSLEQTDTIAWDFSAIVRPGDIIRLDGEMGAGKTTFTRALAKALKHDLAQVSSPTYVIMNLYETEGSTPIAHLDCYRMGDESELDALGWDTVTDGSAIVLIEWAERIEDALPADTARISITPTGENDREFVFEVPEKWMDRAGAAALAPRPDTTCPVTGDRVSGDCPTWPFANERARLLDLNKWFDESHTVSRPIQQGDLEDEF